MRQLFIFPSPFKGESTMKGKPISFYYGWVIVAVGALTLFFSGPGQTYSVSVFIDYYIARYGWSRTAISTFYSIATLFSGLAMPLVGRMIDQRGHRKSLIWISILFAASCVWMSFISAPWMIFIGFMLIRLFGQGSMSLIPAVLVPQWFIQKRGRALSFATIGGVMGFAFMPPLNNMLVESFGAPAAWIFWATALLVIMLPVAFFLVRNRPEDMDLHPDGQVIAEGDHTGDGEEIERSWTFEEAKSTRAFWFMLFCMVVPSLVNTGITFHMISIVGEKGFESGFGAYILSITALTQIPLVFVAGLLLDKVRVHLFKGWNYLILALAIILLTGAQSRIALLGYAICHGVFVAFEGISTNVLWSNYYGRLHLGKIRGITMAVMVLGSAFGPLPFGAAFDLFGGYREILFLALLLPVMASILSFLSPPPAVKE
jgi:MFS family permease